MYPFIDTHAHINDDAYSREEIDEVIKRAYQSGVKYIIIPSVDYNSTLKAIEISNKYQNIYFTAGIHCHEAFRFTLEEFEKIEKALQHPKCIAVGEIGLDYHYNFSPPQVQKEVFAKFINLSIKHDKPMVIHCREAEEDMYRILSKFSGKVKGVTHCYTGDEVWAKQFLKLGFYIGFTGIITFKKSSSLRNVVRQIPLNKILSETDSPYMTPVPHRGKRNEPCYVPLVVEKIAEIKEIELKEVKRQVLENSFTLFKLMEKAFSFYQ